MILVDVVGMKVVCWKYNIPSDLRLYSKPIVMYGYESYVVEYEKLSDLRLYALSRQCITQRKHIAQRTLYDTSVTCRWFYVSNQYVEGCGLIVKYLIWSYR